MLTLSGVAGLVESDNMRDKLKDENYFKELIEKEEKSIMLFENAIKK